jgi:enterochelin esterase-like enzyme
MRPWSKPLAGKLDELTIDSALLRGNLRGDPHVRPIYVYTPPRYDQSAERYPSVYVLHGWTGQVDMWRNRTSLRPTAIELFDELFEQGASPAIVVFVDAWTSWGGSQYLDSPALGLYHSYLCNEIVPWVDARYRTMPQRDHRAVTGKSSGGYGAMVTAMLRPDLFGALATHSGDALFGMPCDRCAASTWTRGRGTSGSSTSAQRPFTTRSAHRV